MRSVKEKDVIVKEVDESFVKLRYSAKELQNAQNRLCKPMWLVYEIPVHNLLDAVENTIENRSKRVLYAPCNSMYNSLRIEYFIFSEHNHVKLQEMRPFSWVLSGVINDLEHGHLFWSEL